MPRRRPLTTRTRVLIAVATAVLCLSGVASGLAIQGGFGLPFTAEVNPDKTQTGFTTLDDPGSPAAVTGVRASDGCRLVASDKVKLRVPTIANTGDGTVHDLLFGGTAVVTNLEQQNLAPNSDLANPITLTGTPGRYGATGEGTAYAIRAKLMNWSRIGTAVRCPKPTGTYQAEMPTPEWRFDMSGDDNRDIKTAGGSYPSLDGTVTFDHPMAYATSAGCTGSCASTGVTFGQPAARYGVTSGAAAYSGGNDRFSVSFPGTNAQLRYTVGTQVARPGASAWTMGLFSRPNDATPSSVQMLMSSLSPAPPAAGPSAPSATKLGGYATVTPSSQLVVPLSEIYAAGDLLLTVATTASVGTAVANPTNGWSTLGASSVDLAPGTTVFTKVAAQDCVPVAAQCQESLGPWVSAASGSSVSVDYTTVSYRVRNWSGNPADVKVSSWDLGGTASPNPPSLTSGYPTSTPTLWLAVTGFTRSASAPSVTAYPNGFSYDPSAEFAGNTSSATTVATVADTASSKDPAAWTLGATTSSRSATIAIRGAGAVQSSPVDTTQAHAGWYAFLNPSGTVTAGMSAGGTAVWQCTTNASLESIVDVEANSSLRPFSGDNWVHLAATYNAGSGTTIYVNGIAQPCTGTGQYANVESGTFGDTANGALWYGRTSSTDTSVQYPLAGSLDDAYFTNVAASGAQVKALVTPVASLTTATEVRDWGMGATTPSTGTNQGNRLVAQGYGASFPAAPAPAFVAPGGPREGTVSRAGATDTAFAATAGAPGASTRRALSTTEAGTASAALGTSSMSLVAWTRALASGGALVSSNRFSFETATVTGLTCPDGQSGLALKLLDAQGGWQTYKATACSELLSSADASLPDVPNVATNRYRMLAATFDDAANQVCFYNNGVRVGSCVTATVTRSTDTANASRTQVAMAQDGTATAMLIDDVAAYVSSLAPATLERMWLAGVPGGNTLP